MDNGCTCRNNRSRKIRLFASEVVMEITNYRSPTHTHSGLTTLHTMFQLLRGTPYRRPLYIHCESKKLDPFSFERNYCKYCRILIFFTVADKSYLPINQAHKSISHFTYSFLLHYLEQELSYRKQIARQLRTQFVEGISVTLKSTLKVTQGHWKRNHWTDHTRLTVRRVIGR